MTQLSKEFKIIDGKVVKDESVVNAGLNLCARLAKRSNSKKPKVASRAKAMSVKGAAS